MTIAAATLEPAVPIRFVRGEEVVSLPIEAITPDSVGLKAVGLSALPRLWTKPFIVIAHGSGASVEAIRRAFVAEGIAGSARLLLRSSWTQESLDQRGALESVTCSLDTVAQQIARLEAQAAEDVGESARVHWVLQEHVSTAAKGHLSNERRIAEDKRDWMAEFEASTSYATESHRISLRNWRDASPPRYDALSCPYRQMLVGVLTPVAKWAYSRLLRIHFEWVYDGKQVYVVQADLCDEGKGGENPLSLVAKASTTKATPPVLRAFRLAVDRDFAQYRKLANAQLYQQLGYSPVPFYVLCDQATLSDVLVHGKISQDLSDDLAQLAQRPLVIRTDGLRIPADCRQMLPRSEELRSHAEAVSWLNTFRTAAIEIAGSADEASKWELCLIAHHFLPAVSAAWCQAHPSQRRVRIESLWGIPEGLYWYAYDTFDVDTQATSVPEASEPPKDLPVREKHRFKEHFVAPNADGKWIVHKTAAGPDWQRSIKRQEWIREIAWSSRKIAAREGKPVVVMWFVGVPRAYSECVVRPWYHEPWHSEASPYKAAPRRKLAQSSEFIVGSLGDWEVLKSRLAGGEAIARVRVDPREPELVRNPEFAKDLGELARQHGIVVELCGGVLSHVYYMLQRTSCTVECSDLDDYATDDIDLEFNKLVRDRVPEVIASRGEAVSLLRLRGEALIASLSRKLVEEALEVLDARSNDEIAEELADVREVMRALMSHLSISEADVESRRRRKAAARGAFEKALMLTRTAVAPSISMSALAGAQDSSADEVPSAARTIEMAAEIPAAWEELALDRRQDSQGTLERMFTADLPVHAAGFKPSQVAFRLDTQDGHKHEMTLELRLDRKGSELRLRGRLINAPVQTSFDFGSPSTDSLDRK